MNAVTISGLVKAYGSHTVLPGLDLEIPTGEMFALLGPNGSGKTTLFRILATLLAPDQGSVSVGGFDVQRDPAGVRGVLGVVFQSPSLDRKLSIRENLRYAGALYNLHGTELRSRMDAALSALRLEEKADALVETLSGGQQRRTEIAKCLITQPKILLMDEPSTGLDPAARIDLWAVIAALRARTGLTVVFTSHLMDESEKADRVGILNAGRLAAAEAPANLLASAGPEVLRVATPDPQAVANWLRENRLEPHALDNEVRVGSPDAHPLAARLTASLGQAVYSTTVAKPTLEDVFLFRTGARLNE
ncbi:MAG: ABC transporter ATP-binding protein [Terrimicrobiaceae bacterium]|nr:ABC transporter ATP-binding protein [Terrimicrobiaceae bacterium]